MFESEYDGGDDYNDDDDYDYNPDYTDYYYHDAWREGYAAGRRSMFPHVAFRSAFRSRFGYALVERAKYRARRLVKRLLRRPWSADDHHIPF
jgi:hypothetical protein